MQNKKKASGRSSRDTGSPRALRQHKKLVENVQVQTKKVAELITSSVRKKEVVGNISSKLVGNNLGGTNLGTAFGLVDFDEYVACVNYDAENQISTSFDSSSKDPESGKLACESETIFSPSFQTSSGGGGLSTENLECYDESSNQHMSVDAHQGEDDDTEEYDDFDPFFFIKNLPDLSSVVPTYRPVLLPKQTRSCPTTTLVLDLDETLVHSTLEPCDDVDFTFTVNFNSKDHTVYVRCRPHLREFLERISRCFEIIIFTASQSIYAKQLLDVLDPKKKIFRHRVYRDSCVYVDGNYLKDLSVLGRDLARVIIIDNSPQAFGFQIDNGIPIESWFDDPSDTELLVLLPFLESLVGVHDVRPLFSKKFNLRQKIAAAVCPLQ